MAENENTLAAGSNPAQPQPGTVIAPAGAQPPPQPLPAQPIEPAPAPMPPPAPVPPAAPETPPPSPPAPPAPPPAPEPSPQPPAAPAEPEQPFALSDDGEPTAAVGDGQSITWTASEFVAHEKSAGWYLGLAAAVILLSVLIFLLTKGVLSVCVIIVAGLLMGVYGSRKPRQVEYRIDRLGVGIGRKHHGYDEFRSFSVAPEGAFASIIFMPLKRFALPTTIYYAPDDEDEIIAMLTDELPFEEHRPDAIDRLMRRIRF